MGELDFRNFGIEPENIELKKRIYEVFSEIASFGDLRLRAAILYYGSVSKAAKAFDLSLSDFTALIEPQKTSSEDEKTILQCSNYLYPRVDWDPRRRNRLDSRVEAEFCVCNMYIWWEFGEAAKFIEFLPDAERIALFNGASIRSKRKSLSEYVDSWKKDIRLTHIYKAIEMLEHYFYVWHMRSNAHYLFGRVKDRQLKFRMNIEELSSISRPCSVATEIFQEYDTYDYHRTETQTFIKNQRIVAKSHRKKFMKQVAERDGSSACKACGSENKIVLDHVFPVSLGGFSELVNFQLLCAPCNSKKSDRLRRFEIK